MYLSLSLSIIHKVMTPNPECATLETTILDALHIMHDGKFLHLPVLDKGKYYSINTFICIVLEYLVKSVMQMGMLLPVWMYYK